MDKDFHSLSKGVFIIPFLPSEDESETPKPMSEVYKTTFNRYKESCESYESVSTAEQVDAVASWLNRCSDSSALSQTFPVRRLPIAIIQNVSHYLPPLLSSVFPHSFTLHGRDVSDLTSATRAIASGFLGEARFLKTLRSKSSGQAGMDEVEKWWNDLKNRPNLLLHIHQAQLIPSAIFAELVYILNLHDVPIHLVISVPFISTFLQSWTLVEPSEVDVSILAFDHVRKRVDAVSNILQIAMDPKATPLAITPSLAVELKREEKLVGGGTLGVFKALKWLLLHHSYNSHLASVEALDDAQLLERLQVIIKSLEEGMDVPERELFVMDYAADLIPTQNPTPRLTVLHALDQPKSFLSLDGDPHTNECGEDLHINERQLPVEDAHEPSSDDAGNSLALENDEDSSLPPRKSRRITLDRKMDYVALSGKTTRRSRKSRDVDAPSTPSNEPHPRLDLNQNGQLKPSQGSPPPSQSLHNINTLFSLWRLGGKTVNLWDWFEGFLEATMEGKDAKRDNYQFPIGAELDVDHQMPGRMKRKTGIVSGAKSTDEEQYEEEDEEDRELQARLHALFVRFCEESRMLGLVRARGKGAGKRGDEVVKGVLMI